MKFKIDRLETYKGQDLILLMGTPGSRWSSIHRAFCECPDVNITDWSEDRSWGDGIYGINIHDKVDSTSIHDGAYWGPGNLYGKNFEHIDSLSKDQIIKEFMDAFDNWNGIKVIKSHWFSYNIEYLHFLFPAAKLVFCYAGDIESFYWWHKCGGWGLGYANYSWYRDDIRLLEKIKEENSNILKFCIDKDLEIKKILKSQLFSMCGIDYTPEKDLLTKCKVSVYTGGYNYNFSHLDSYGR